MRLEHGFSMVELLVTLAVFGIFLAAAAIYLRPLEAPVETSAIQLEGAFRHARARALATTSAFRVQPASSRRVRSERAADCGASTWTPESTLDLQRDVTMTSSGWSVCFNNRGLASTDLVVTLIHPDYRTRQVEVMLGGAARVVE